MKTLVKRLGEVGENVGAIVGELVSEEVGKNVSDIGEVV